jgi:HD-GYP domain-containing protein (c-di-GMP phosphodiesterase class II)
VTNLALNIGTLMGMSGNEIRELILASRLHDIGYIFLDRDIMELDRELYDSEWEQVKRHPVLGAELMNSFDIFSKVPNIIMRHHEYVDGSGYPSGLGGGELGAAEKVLAVADAVEAMTAERPYRKRYTKEKIYNELIQSADVRFDGLIVDKLLKLQFLK